MLPKVSLLPTRWGQRDQGVALLVERYLVVMLSTHQAVVGVADELAPEIILAVLRDTAAETGPYAGEPVAEVPVHLL